MTLALTQTVTAVGVNGLASFLANGGTSPYVYSVMPGGSGGSINSATGAYRAPSVANSNPKTSYDTIVVTDSAANTATAQILVGTPLILFCDVIQKGMNLTSDRVYLWDQKIFQPNDSDVYIAVSQPYCKPYSNINRTTTINGAYVQTQDVNMFTKLNVDIISRGPAARDRKEEVVAALYSVYAEQQQEANNFYIGRVSSTFNNLSNVDGAAIPYRYQISCNMQYIMSYTKPAPYFDTFNTTTVTVDGP